MLRPLLPRSPCMFVLALFGLLLQAGLSPTLRAEGTGAGPRLRQLRIRLNEVLDMKDFQQPMTLKEALGLIQDKLNAQYKEEDILPILIDAEAFKREHPDDKDVYDTQVKFPPFPRRMTVATALKVALSKIPSGDATFLLRGGYVEVTTLKQASLQRLLRQKVFATLKDMPLVEAVEELSAQTGVSVLLDPRLADKLKAPVTASLNGNITLEGALRFLTDMVGARLYVSEDGVYVTSTANAEALRKERKARLQERWWEQDEVRRTSGSAAGARDPARRQPKPEKRGAGEKDPPPVPQH